MFQVWNPPKTGLGSLDNFREKAEKKGWIPKSKEPPALPQEQPSIFAQIPMPVYVGAAVLVGLMFFRK